jgi:hypothetical protein
MVMLQAAVRCGLSTHAYTRSLALSHPPGYLAMFFPLLSEPGSDPWSYLSPGYIAFFALMLSIGYEVQAHPPEGTQVLWRERGEWGGGEREREIGRDSSARGQ